MERRQRRNSGGTVDKEDGRYEEGNSEVGATFMVSPEKIGGHHKYYI